jgi:hypothetical protein
MPDCPLRDIGRDWAYLVELRIESVNFPEKEAGCCETTTRRDPPRTVRRNGDVSPDMLRRRIMRIDYGPNFDEIRDSIHNGTVVTFGSSRGEKLRCVVLDAKMDHGSGRAALTVEEQNTSTIYFARYICRAGRNSCGDLVTWRLKLNEMEELRRSA